MEYPNSDSKILARQFQAIAPLTASAGRIARAPREFLEGFLDTHNLTASRHGAGTRKCLNLRELTDADHPPS